MDLAAFSEDNFDPKEWINKTFRNAESQVSKEAFVRNMVKKLQLYVQQVNCSLEDTSQQVLASLPRVSHETEVLCHEARSLQKKLQEVEGEISKVKKNAGDSIASLEALDKIKNKMLTAKQALHEADNWSILAADIEELFESGDVASIAEKIENMQSSLNALTSVSDFENRKMQLEGLKNRLEALVSPQLVQAFSSGSTDDSMKFVKIFSAMDRSPNLLKYYTKFQKSLMCQKWHDTVNSEQEETVADWMKSFYSYLFSNYHSLSSWVTQVFTPTSPTDMLCKLYVDVHLNLQPSLSSCISTGLKQQNQQLNYLIELKQISQQFANNMKSVISDRASLESIYSVIYQVYTPFTSDYAKLEKDVVEQELSKISSERDDLMDVIQGFSQNISSVMTIANNVESRCYQFSNCAVFSQLVQVQSTLFMSYLKQHSSIIDQLESKTSPHEDWNLFQMCLTFLQSLGEFLNEIKLYEKDLKSKITNAWKSAALESSRYITSELLRRKLEQQISSLEDDPDADIFSDVLKQIEENCKKVHSITYKVIFSPIAEQLKHTNDICQQFRESTQELPDYSYAPQEYVTQIGEYLITLPQHLEPFLLRENPALVSALRLADLSYQSNQSADSASILLNMVAHGTCSKYSDHILSIDELLSSHCKQLVVDIDYLGNVLEELGVHLTETLQQIKTLLGLSPETYKTAQTMGVPAKLVSAIRQMRNIASTDSMG
nr:PREDICTED: conserved oligomeric Golgi complex subunit 7 [Bemisia tabaci]